MFNPEHTADEAFRLAARRGGSAIACREGCSECCRTPFAITQDDAERLRRGMATLPLQQAEDIRARASDVWRRMQVDFPGDSETGELRANAEWRAWFFERHRGVACPVLDPQSGQCRLYAYRPVCCRLYGPLIEINGHASGPCPLCYSGISPSGIAALGVSITVPESPEGPETVIAAVLARQP